ncbi:TBC1 domain family member 5 [Carabus blaptoides fortunei]
MNHLNQGEEWYQIFNKPNLIELQKEALQGKLRASKFRSVCWYVLLNVLPENSKKWLDHIYKLRITYNKIKQKLSCDPWTNKTANDDPLSQSDNSLWNKHFCDEELRSVIKQDVVRTFPGVDFFRKSLIQEIMVSILFTYAREHPVMCYRQGMHELLAPLLFVLHCDQQAMLHIKEQTHINETIREILNPNYLEEDGYHLFAEMMCAMASSYHTSNVQPTATGYFPTNTSAIESPGGSRDGENEVVSQLNVIRDKLLQSVDPELCQHLKNLDITLPLFGIRWLRLLFGREFPLQDLLVLWDAIFSQEKDFKFVHYIVVAMLVAIRKQLLDGDYTACLMLLMRYPANVDVTYVIEYALHLQNPQIYLKPPIKTEIIAYVNVQKKRNETHTDHNYVNKHKFISVVKPKSTSSNKHVPLTKENSTLKWETDTDISRGLADHPERLIAELKHARSIMSLSRLKLLQYHKVLMKAVGNTENSSEAMLALDGIHELCNLLTSRYYTQQPTEVEHAVEAGEVRPTELNLNTTIQTVVVGQNKYIPQKTSNEEMKLISCTVGKAIHGVPMSDPTNRT